MIVRPSLGHVSRSSPSAQPAGFPLRRTATLAGAATLMLLLAACGSGSGGSSRDKAVSSSPTPPTNQTQNAGTGSSSNNGTLNGGSSGSGATGGQTHAGGSTGNGGTGHAGSGNANAGTGGSGSGGTSGGQGAGSSSSGGAGGSTPGQGHGAGGSGSVQPGGHAGSSNAGGSNSGGSNAGNGSTGNIGRWGPAPSISARGISGDVLATMINQPGSSDSPLLDGPSAAHPQDGLFRASRWSTQPPAGHAVSGDVMRIDQKVLGKAFSGTYVYYLLQDGDSSRGVSEEYWNLYQTLSFSSTVKGFVPNQVGSLASMVYAPVGTPLLTLQTEAEVIEGLRPGYAPPFGYEFHLKGVHPFVVEKGTLVPFNQVLRHWSSAEGVFMQLFVANASRADEARLCLNVHGSALKRLTCARYTVPAGWKLGQPLVRQGYYVVDDQSPVASRRDLRYWNATAADLPKHPLGY